MVSNEAGWFWHFERITVIHIFFILLIVIISSRYYSPFSQCNSINIRAKKYQLEKNKINEQTNLSLKHAIISVTNNRDKLGELNITLKVESTQKRWVQSIFLFFRVFPSVKFACILFPPSSQFGYILIHHSFKCSVLESVFQIILT